MGTNRLITPGLYEHYKGNRYMVIGIGRHSESHEQLVIYQALYDSEFGSSALWVRPINLFFDQVTYRDKMVPRFSPVKQIKFAADLVPHIISREKEVTWRLWDDKNIQVGDMLDFFEYKTDNLFAKARVTAMQEKRFQDLTVKDFEGHETYTSDQEMYATYEKYYGRPISPETVVKIIGFELI